jgi:hypothetical protein
VNLRRTVDDATARLAKTAGDTKAAVVTVAVLAAVALAVACVALVLALGEDRR